MAMKTSITPPPASASIARFSALMDQDELRDIPLDWLEPDPDQDRKDWESSGAGESMEELTESIRALGVRRPIEVIKSGDRKFRIIAGERRYRAAQAVGIKNVPCIVRMRLENHAKSLDMLTENLNRRDLNPIELAEALQRRLEEGITRDDLLKAIGQKSAWLSKRLSLLKMKSDVQEVARRGLLRDIDTLTRLDKLKDPYRARLLASAEEGAFDRRMLDAAELAATTTGSTHATLRAGNASGGLGGGGNANPASSAKSSGTPAQENTSHIGEKFSPEAAFHVLMTRSQMAWMLSQITGNPHHYDMADLPQRFAAFLEDMPE